MPNDLTLETLAEFERAAYRITSHPHLFGANTPCTVLASNAPDLVAALRAALRCATALRNGYRHAALDAANKLKADFPGLFPKEQSDAKD